MPAFLRKNSTSSATSATRSSDRNAAKKNPPTATATIPSSNSNRNNSRVSLHKRPSAMGSQYQTTCISKHYAVNHKVYEAFKANYYNLSSVVDTTTSQNNRKPGGIVSTTTAKSNFEWISGAFCLGYSFVETALFELPQHGYFYSNEDPHLVKLRKRSALAALEVTKLLQRIVKLLVEASGWAGAGGPSSSNFSLSSSSSPSRNLEADDPKALLLEDNREECKRKLSALKKLAKEQSEHLDTYEAKRKTALAEWNSMGTGSTDTRDSPKIGHLGKTTGSRRGNSAVVGNHRGKKKSATSTDNLLDGASADSSTTTPTKAAANTNSGAAGASTTATVRMDCEAVGETLLSCSRLFCPGTALSEADIPRSIAVTMKDGSQQQPQQPPQWSTTTPIRTARKSSLADRTNDDNSDDSVDNRSDGAVFDDANGRSPATTVGSINRSTSDKSDEAVFQQSPPTQAVKSDDAVNHDSPHSQNKKTNPKSPPSRKLSGSWNDCNRSNDSFSTSDTTSTKSGKERRARRKRTPKSSRSKKDDSTKNAFNRLFGKKSPPRQESAPGSSNNYRTAPPRQATTPSRRHQKKSREQTEFEEALYQSQLEAAKAASMREEDVVDPIYHQEQELQRYGSKNRNTVSSSGERDSPSSPLASTGGPPPGAKADAEDFDLQRALYLSGLEVTKLDGTHWNPQEPREHEACTRGHYRQDLLATEEEEEKRDDSAGELGGTSRGTDPVVVRGVPVGTGPVIVKGTPVVRSPDPFDSLQIVKGCCRKDFERLRSSGKISVVRVPTYQGKTQDSTNGCTVIAPLLCVHHFRNPATAATKEACRIADTTVASVIDTETPAILPAIRKSLGVSKNAFLIPHDAHEALIESRHMSRDQFVTVCGGNILEDCHLGALIRELSKVLPDGKKLGATFFFHQHVIAILQLRDATSDDENSTAVSFDVIDSLPNKATFESQPQTEPSDDKNCHRNCARIFCKDASSLKATLKWYACSVFTPENQRYIDTYHWDEKLTDFDPRVFQAFLWKEM